MSIRCAIVDDEPIAARGIAGYAAKTTALEVVGVYESAIDLNNALQLQKIDLVFLDIEMPYLTGINWLKTVTNPPKIIFTTAYDRYAIEGFELDVVDYLLKPVSFERFLKAVNKAQALFPATSDHIFIKVDGRHEKLVFHEILYVESLQNYVIFHMINKKLISHMTMKTVEEQLPTHLFLRTHKSYLINVSHVSALEGMKVILRQQTVIPIGKTQKELVIPSILNQTIRKK